MRSALLAALMLTAAPALAHPKTAETGSAPSEDVRIRVPEGFSATVFARDLGCVRHIAIAEDGTLYAAMRQRRCAAGDGGIVVVKDSDGDGMADAKAWHGDIEGTGLALHDGHLYFGADRRVVRYDLNEDGMPSADAQVIVQGFPRQRQHASKPITFGPDGAMYVTVGAPSNACQERTRSPGSKGLKPCPQLTAQAGIWRYKANETDQVHDPAARYVTGIRNAVALDWHGPAGKLVFANHGRDQLNSLWPAHYDVEDNAELPGEEIHVVEAQGEDFGWPYTYWDQRQGRRMLAPEYGGDGETTESEGYQDPDAAMPGHWGPNDLIIYTAEQFPQAYRNGALIAFHGSWNRAPLPQQGYNVVFVPMDAQGQVTGDPVVFADMFKGEEPLANPRNAQHRPMGLAVGPDGALYIADSVKGWVWKVAYEG
ncbi:MAG: PQQ-dependent sugar dehydrogenase [Rhodothalassiaceae bacterium]